MIDDDLHALVPQVMLAETQLLQAHVILKHPPDMYRNRLTAEGLIEWIVQV